MKKNLAIYLALFSLLFVGNSCMPGDDDNLSYSPYAMLESFKLGNVRSSYPAFTDDGRDTIVEKTVDFSTVKFSINQATGEVYNVDSLPYATDVSKLVVNIGVNGSASIYVDSIAAYDYFLTTDSLDFSRPRKIRVMSYDTKYRRDYVVSVNVHKVEPELMEWNKNASPEELAPLRVVEFGNRMCLFGDKNGKPADKHHPSAHRPVNRNDKGRPGTNQKTDRPQTERPSYDRPHKSERPQTSTPTRTPQRTNTKAQRPQRSTTSKPASRGTSERGNNRRDFGR